MSCRCTAFPVRRAPIVLVLGLVLAAGGVAHASPPAPPDGVAVYDHDLARAGLLKRARTYVTTVASAKPLLDQCTLPEALVNSQRTLEATFRAAVLELGLATAEEFDRWKAVPPRPPGAAAPLPLTPQQCGVLIRRLSANQGQYDNLMREIDVLRRSL